MLFERITLIDGNYEEKPDMYLQTEGNRIVYIGAERPKDYTGETYDGKNKVAMPGFYNLHCHIPDTLLRGYGEGLPLHRWLTEKMFPFEAKLTEEDIYWSSMLGACELIRSGVASFTDMFYTLPQIERAVRDSGLKASLCFGTTALPGLSGYREYVAYQETEGLRRRLAAAADDRIRVDVGLHAEYTSHEALMRDVADYARETGLRVHLHLSETQKEHEECKARHNGLTPAALFEKVGLFDVPATAAHCVWIEGEDFDIFRRHGVTVAHNPSSNMKLGSGYAPVKKMLESGVRVGIGTDGAASNNNLNMLEEVTLASMLGKGLNGDPTFLSPSELLEMSCRNGAQAQGRADCGALEVGNRADIVVYDLDRSHLVPTYDVLPNIFYAAAASDICLNMIDGEVVFRDGVLTRIDEERVKAEARSRAARILSEL